jgi:hypothetical protein
MGISARTRHTAIAAVSQDSADPQLTIVLDPGNYLPLPLVSNRKKPCGSSSADILRIVNLGLASVNPQVCREMVLAGVPRASNVWAQVSATVALA